MSVSSKLRDVSREYGGTDRIWVFMFVKCENRFPSILRLCRCSKPPINAMTSLMSSNRFRLKSNSRIFGHIAAKLPSPDAAVFCVTRPEIQSPSRTTIRKSLSSEICFWIFSKPTSSTSLPLIRIELADNADAFAAYFSRTASSAVIALSCGRFGLTNEPAVG